MSKKTSESKKANERKKVTMKKVQMGLCALALLAAVGAAQGAAADRRRAR